MVAVDDGADPEGVRAERQRAWSCRASGRRCRPCRRACTRTLAPFSLAMKRKVGVRSLVALGRLAAAASSAGRRARRLCCRRSRGRVELPQSFSGGANELGRGAGATATKSAALSFAVVGGTRAAVAQPRPIVRCRASPSGIAGRGGASGAGDFGGAGEVPPGEAVEVVEADCAAGGFDRAAWAEWRRTAVLPQSSTSRVLWLSPRATLAGTGMAISLSPLSS